ncbi:uncharacterized protein LOC132314119 [Cornus florida]|uniref:uncharacterized protein LOC132314119 n=1 Tax=Cornus florida TaxID=4283 RepID=UPI002896F5BA|nr:uncharacterized protein LOC132314119 [Cornus florida]
MLQVDEVGDKVVLTTFIGGLQSSKFLFSLSKNPPNSIVELFIKAQKHMNVEGAMNSRLGKGVDDKKGDKKRLAFVSKDERDSKFSKPDRSPKVPRGRDSYTNFTPLNAPISKILMQLQDDHTLKWPPKLKSDFTRRSKDKYCWFHRDYGHNTDDCLDLKSQIESLIRRGKLHGYAAVDREKGTGQPIRENKENNPLRHPLGEIRVISGGLTGGGKSSSARKAHIRRARGQQEQGIGELRGDQATARECYAAVLKPKLLRETLAIETPEGLMDKEPTLRAEPVEDLVEIDLDEEGTGKKVSIGSLLDPLIRDLLI